MNKQNPTLSFFESGFIDVYTNIVSSLTTDELISTAPFNKTFRIAAILELFSRNDAKSIGYQQKQLTSSLIRAFSSPTFTDAKALFSKKLIQVIKSSQDFSVQYKTLLFLHQLNKKEQENLAMPLFKPPFFENLDSSLIAICSEKTKEEPIAILYFLKTLQAQSCLLTEEDISEELIFTVRNFLTHVDNSVRKEAKKTFITLMPITRRIIKDNLISYVFPHNSLNYSSPYTTLGYILRAELNNNQKMTLCKALLNNPLKDVIAVNHFQAIVRDLSLSKDPLFTSYLDQFISALNTCFGNISNTTNLFQLPSFPTSGRISLDGSCSQSSINLDEINSKLTMLAPFLDSYSSELEQISSNVFKQFKSSFTAYYTELRALPRDEYFRRFRHDTHPSFYLCKILTHLTRNNDDSVTKQSIVVYISTKLSEHIDNVASGILCNIIIHLIPILTTNQINQIISALHTQIRFFNVMAHDDEEPELYSLFSTAGHLLTITKNQTLVDRMFALALLYPITRNADFLNTIIPQLEIDSPHIQTMYQFLLSNENSIRPFFNFNFNYFYNNTGLEYMRLCISLLPKLCVEKKETLIKIILRDINELYNIYFIGRHQGFFRDKGAFLSSIISQLESPNEKNMHFTTLLQTLLATEPEWSNEDRDEFIIHILNLLPTDETQQLHKRTHLHPLLEQRYQGNCYRVDELVYACLSENDGNEIERIIQIINLKIANNQQVDLANTLYLLTDLFVNKYDQMNNTTRAILINQLCQKLSHNDDSVRMSALKNMAKVFEIKNLQESKDALIEHIASRLTDDSPIIRQYALVLNTSILTQCFSSLENIKIPDLLTSNEYKDDNNYELTTVRCILTILPSINTTTEYNQTIQNPRNQNIGTL